MLSTGEVLVRIADRLRSEAASGLFWQPEAAEAKRLLALRRLSAALMSEADSRDEAEIAAIFERDRGLRTPGSAITVRLCSSEGAMVVRHWRINLMATLTEQLERCSALAQARIGAQPVGAVDTDSAGLACHQTHLFTYEGQSRLAAVALEARLEPSDSGLASMETATGWPLPSGEASTVAPVVSSQVAKLLCEASSLAVDGMDEAVSPYDRERWARVAAWCMHQADPDAAYRRCRIEDLTTPVVASGAEVAIFDSSRRLLLIRRTDTGQWAMPGGACELGETIAQTATREVFEETGLAVEITGLVGVFDNREAFDNARIPIIATFLARSRVESPRLNLAALEATEAIWVDQAQSRTLEYFRGHDIRVPAAFAAASR